MARQGGFGAKLRINISSVMTAIVHIEDFEFPELEKLLVEVTGHDSPGGWSEQIPTGKKRANAFTCTLTWDRTQSTHQAVVAAFDSELPVELEAADPDEVETIAFEAHINKMGRITDQEGSYQCEVEVTPTGLVLIDYGSS